MWTHGLCMAHVLLYDLPWTVNLLHIQNYISNLFLFLKSNIFLLAQQFGLANKTLCYLKLLEFF